jgi:hypothetical protein
MGVDIDEARHDEAAGGVDFLRAAPVDGADRDDAVAGDCDIGDEARRAAAVDDASITDDEIKISHVSTLLASELPSSPLPLLR